MKSVGIYAIPISRPVSSPRFQMTSFSPWERRNRFLSRPENETCHAARQSHEQTQTALLYAAPGLIYPGPARRLERLPAGLPQRKHKERDSER